MQKNKYVTDFDRKVNSMISRYESGEVSERVLGIALGMLFEKQFGEKISNTLNIENEKVNRSMGISFKRITEHYNGTI